MNNKAMLQEFAVDLDLTALRQLQNVFKAELSLYEFIRQAWSSIEGNTPFIDSWHIQAMAEHLEACFNREIKNLLINVPPRTSKTSVISVAFPAWVWLHNPQEKFMYASYATSLSIEHSLKCRRLIESSWYQQCWGNRYQLARDQKAKSFFENDKKGYRISTSIGAAATGKGASILVADDPNSAKEGQSDVKRDTTNSWWDQVWSTRLNDPKNDVKIVVQQRIHEQDISGHIIGNDSENEWVRLILPMEFETVRKSQTFINGELWWEDPRIRDGDLLSAARFSNKEIDRYKNDLGSYGYAGQYQQRPSPLEGGIIKKNWFKWWKERLSPKFEHIIQSWDTAISDLPTAAYSACTTWGVFYDNNDIGNVILLSQWRGRVNYPELRDRAQRLYRNYNDTGEVALTVYPRHAIDLVLIESKATGDPLIQDLKRAGIRAFPYNPTGKGDKVGRVQKISHYIEGGLVWLPAKGPNFDKLLPWADEFLEMTARFPNAESNDIVDSMTQVLSKLRDTNFLDHPRDEKKIEQSVKTRHLY